MQTLTAFVQRRPFVALVSAFVVGLAVMGAINVANFVRGEYAQFNAIRVWAAPKIMQERQLQQQQRPPAQVNVPGMRPPVVTPPSPTPAPDPSQPERK